MSPNLPLRSHKPRAPRKSGGTYEYEVLAFNFFLFLTVCWGVRPTLALICLYIIAYSHTNMISRPHLRIAFSSYLYISIIFMFTCFLKSFVLVYCSCFYYACIYVIVSLLLHVYNYIHARFRSFKACLRVASR